MPWKGKYLVYCRIKYQVTRNTASSLEFTALQYEYASTVEFTAFQLEIRHLWSKLLPYSTKYGDCARTYCLTPEYTSTVEFTALKLEIRHLCRIYCLIARNTAAALELTALHPNTRLPSNSLPFSSKYGRCAQILPYNPKYDGCARIIG